MATISERLVDLARGIRFENLPADVVRESGRRLLDALGCMIAGAPGALYSSRAFSGHRSP